MQVYFTEPAAIELDACPPPVNDFPLWWDAFEYYELHEGGGMTKRIDTIYSDLVYVKEKFKAQSPRNETQSSKLEEHSSIQSFNLTRLGRHSILRYWKSQKSEFTTETQRFGIRLDASSSYPVYKKRCI